MHRLIQTQTFDIRPRERSAFLTTHFLGPQQSFKCHIFSTALRIGLCNQIRKLKPNPRHDHRPRFHTTEPVDALFERHIFQDIFQRIIARVVDQSTNFHRPGIRRQRPCIFRRITFIRAKFVKIIISSYVFKRRKFQPSSIFRLGCRR